MEQNIKTLSGEVADVFAHRFVVATEDGKVLADLGPKGAQHVTLKVGDRVELTGDAKPSELKVLRITQQGREPVEIGHEAKKDKHGQHDEHGGDADPSVALRAVESNGFTVVGDLRRKPRHFEITGRDAAGDMVELHVKFDGAIRKTKPVRSEAA